jgi:hypothetical protein
MRLPFLSMLDNTIQVKLILRGTSMFKGRELVTYCVLLACFKGRELVTYCVLLAFFKGRELVTYWVLLACFKGRELVTYWVQAYFQCG